MKQETSSSTIIVSTAGGSFKPEHHGHPCTLIDLVMNVIDERTWVKHGSIIQGQFNCIKK